MVAEALKAAERLNKQGISARVINIHTIKPLDESLIIKAAKETNIIITIEEHSIIGGLGDAVCSVLSENLPTRVIRLGVNDCFGHSGSDIELLEQFGLCSANIVNVAREAIIKYK